MAGLRLYFCSAVNALALQSKILHFESMHFDGQMNVLCLVACVMRELALLVITY